jgi:hypothetical protein
MNHFTSIELHNLIINLFSVIKKKLCQYSSLVKMKGLNFCQQKIIFFYCSFIFLAFISIFGDQVINFMRAIKR